MNRVPDFVNGAIDLHVHSSPDIDPRRYNDIELAREAARAGMAAVLIKSHQFPTAERAWLVSQVVSGIRVFGGLVLNETVGGVNPAAVKSALQLGARQIWFPTRSARNHRQHHNQPGGICVLDADGHLVAEAREVIALAAAAGCVVGTGHLSPEEGTAVVQYAHDAGARVLITHPEWSVTDYPIELQRSLAGHGCVFFERCFVSMTHRGGHTPFARIRDAIAEVGAETTLLSTDLGQPDTLPPVEGLRKYAGMLAAEGFAPDELRLMIHDNPAALLRLQGEGSHI